MRPSKRSTPKCNLITFNIRHFDLDKNIYIKQWDEYDASEDEFYLGCKEPFGFVCINDIKLFILNGYDNEN